MKEKLHFCGLFAAIIETFRFHPEKIMPWSILTLLLFFFSVESIAQQDGDYQSNGTGYWTEASTWEVYQGPPTNAWTSAINYPGQINEPNAAVEIQEGHVITLDENNNLSNPSAEMGTITINGELALIGETNEQIEFYLNTLELIVTPYKNGQSVGGVINFTSKVKLILPANAYISVEMNEDINPEYYGLVVDTSCNHNQDIQIGDIVIAFCRGAPGVALTFYELMQSKGSMQAIITYTLDCIGPKITVSGEVLFEILFYTVQSFTWVVTETPIAGAPVITTPTEREFDLIINDTSSYSILFDVVGRNLKNQVVLGQKLATLSFAPTVWQYDVVNDLNFWGQDDGNGNMINILPEDTLSAEIEESYDTNVDGSFSTCCLKVVNSTLTIGPNSFVNVEDHIINNGTVVVEHEGSLVQVNETDTNSGNGDYEIHKTTRPYHEYDYTYWSSPVVGETVGDAFIANGSPYNRIFWLNTANFLDLYDGPYTQTTGNPDTFDDNGDDWQYAYSGNIMTPGKGYIAMGAGADFPFDGNNIDSGLIQNVSFEGARVNNGEFSYPVVQDGGVDGFTNQNLIGNPYPSAIDIRALMAANTNVFDGNFYFWTHDTPIALRGPWGYNFTNDDYAQATVDVLGNLSSVAAGNGTGTDIPLLGFIASGQGFLANVKDGISNPSNIIFKNSMRVVDYNADFKHTTLPVDRFWLNMTNEKDVFRQIYLGFKDTTTDDFQNGQDGERMHSVDVINFYSIIPDDDRRFAIQNLATFNDLKTIDLGVSVIDAGAYTITVDHVEGIFTTQQDIYLKDYKTNTLYNLSQDPYVFTVTDTELGDIKDRFELRFVDEKDDTEESLINSVAVYPNPSEHIFNISWRSGISSRIEVYDLLGKLIKTEGLKQNTNSYQLDLSGFSKGIYFANIEIDGQQVIKKLILK